MKSKTHSADLGAVKSEMERLTVLSEQLKNEKEQLEEQIKQLTRYNEQLEERVAWFKEQSMKMRLRTFSPSSEQNILSGGQIAMVDFFNEAEACCDPDAEEPAEKEVFAKTASGKKKKGKREYDFSQMEHEIVPIEITEEDCICKACGKQMVEIGTDILRSEVIHIPARYIVRDYTSPVLKCKDGCCSEDGTDKLIKGTAPTPFIPKSGVASASLVSSIIADKYIRHLPLYRQEAYFSTLGIAISRQTMSNWVVTTALDYLVNLWQKMSETLLKQPVLMADGTMLQVLHESGRKATSLSNMFVYRTCAYAEHQVILYNYQISKGSEEIKKFLAGFQGMLQTDGAQAFLSLKGMTHATCWAHVRRKFTDVLKLCKEKERQKHGAAVGLRYIDKLFVLERSYKGLSAEKRYEERLNQSKPVAEEFFAWAENCGALPKSAFGRAVKYALNQKPYLMNIFNDGRLELSNNLTENAIRPFTLGRKNWLFANTPRGADASSVIYTIIETAKANGLNPVRYLDFVLSQFPCITISQIPELLPWGSLIPPDCKET